MHDEVRPLVVMLLGEAHRSDAACLPLFERDLRELPPQVRALRQKQTAGQKREAPEQPGDSFVGEKPLHGRKHFSREAKAVLHSESRERFELGRYEPAIPTLAGQPSLLL